MMFVRGYLRVKVHNFALSYFSDIVRSTAVITVSVCVLQNAFIDELVVDIIDDVTCGLCFEIHRACKLGILFLDETDPE